MGMVTLNEPATSPLRSRKGMPKHCSWLNMAEIEIGLLSRQCLDRRIVSCELLQSEVDAWQDVRNAEQRTIEWNFPRQDADRKSGAQRGGGCQTPHPL